MNALLKMLAAENEEQAVETLTKFQSFLSDVRAATGTSDSEAALSAVKASAQFRTSVASLLGASGDDAAVLASIKSTVESAKASEARQADLSAVLAAVGEESVSAALGAIATAVNARDELLPKAQAQLSELSKKAEEDEASALLADLEKDPKNPRITPAQKESLWPSLSIEGKRAFAKTAPPINGASLGAKDEDEVVPDTLTTFNGKSFAEMTFAEKAEFKSADPLRYEAARAESKKK